MFESVRTEQSSWMVVMDLLAVIDWMHDDHETWESAFRSSCSAASAGSVI